MLLNVMGTALPWLCSQPSPHVKSARQVLGHCHSCVGAGRHDGDPLHKVQGCTGCAGI